MTHCIGDQHGAHLPFHRIVDSVHRINKDYGSHTDLTIKPHVSTIILADHPCIIRPTSNTGLIFTDMLHLGSIVVIVPLAASEMHIRILDCCSDLTAARMPDARAVFLLL